MSPLSNTRYNAAMTASLSLQDVSIATPSLSAFNSTKHKRAKGIRQIKGINGLTPGLGISGGTTNLMHILHKQTEH